jgi:uncharacterized protein YmfQ (DUF2313 family)
MSAPNYQASDFVGAIQALMPRGLAWPTDPTSVQTQVIGGLAPTWVRHAESNNNLLVDAFPATSVQLLPDWESTLGLPDPCAGESPILAVRQQQVVARLTNGGGQSIAFFTAYAAALGYAVTATEFAPFRVGQSRVGQQLGTQDWFFTWQLNVAAQTVTYFTVGQSAVGQPLAYWNNAVLECEMNEIKPAHTYLNFAYSGIGDVSN